MGESYRSAGVDLDAADEVVRRLGPLAASTTRPGVLGGLGGFGGLLHLAGAGRWRDPVLVASTDGVGTKVLVARATGRWDTIGIDLVAMSTDDVAAQGAEPLLFLDYVGVGRLDPDVVEAIVAGVAEGCRRAGCALLGGETAEHPGTGDGVELVGSCVGVVERDRIVTGGRIAPGDALVGLRSLGVRSNGLSLARRVFERAGLGLDDPAWSGATSTVADELLRPSVVYARAVVDLVAAVDVHGLAHVTGGGLPGNLVRIAPPAADLVVHVGSWPVPGIFGAVRRLGDVDDAEMARTFNLGVGFVAVVPAADAPRAVEVLGGHGVEAGVVGEVRAGAGRVVLDGAWSWPD